MYKLCVTQKGHCSYYLALARSSLPSALMDWREDGLEEMFSPSGKRGVGSLGDKGRVLGKRLSVTTSRPVCTFLRWSEGSRDQGHWHRGPRGGGRDADSRSLFRFTAREVCAV